MFNRGMRDAVYSITVRPIRGAVTLALAVVGIFVESELGELPSIKLLAKLLKQILRQRLSKHVRQLVRRCDRENLDVS